MKIYNNAALTFFIIINDHWSKVVIFKIKCYLLLLLCLWFSGLIHYTKHTQNHNVSLLLDWTDHIYSHWWHPKNINKADVCLLLFLFFCGYYQNYHYYQQDIHSMILLNNWSDHHNNTRAHKIYLLRLGLTKVYFILSLLPV